ncbi:hypothetical protein [Mycobacterium paraterrae]|uniref:Transmembrane protein n=1 Tax=Mycobacterium paraterrae TaxID=577492 RepID=A0ABY3VRK5_9MYCO|nr:hypothetical protein [Mycobacterium paraterrae]UMB70134.1 hypothetical protein MKK62_01965 [Mycobacterium paraterrae]
MHTSPLTFVIVGLVLGIGVVAYGRRSDTAQRRSRVLLAGGLVVLAILLAIDFVTKPGERWVSGVGLVGALIAAGGYLYQRVQGSKTRSG